jgi:hypothetical protein
LWTITIQTSVCVGMSYAYPSLEVAPTFRISFDVIVMVHMLQVSHYNVRVPQTQVRE